MKGNVLFLAPSFYNYWQLIKTGISKNGYDVDSIIYPDYGVYKLFLVISRKLYSKIVYLYYKKQITDLRNCYDKVFVIKSSAIPISYLLLLKERCYSAEFILYLWDDLSIDSGEKERLRFFNKIYSFSKFDCEKYGFNFRPMFYNDSLVPTIINKSIDLFYVASYKENRFRFIKKLYSNNNLTSIHKKIILRCSIFLFLKKIEHLKYIRCFRMTPIKYDKMVDYLSRSRCSLEIQHPGQTGLTTRPIEALLTKTKIITTNKSIVDYSIYCPENIKIIEELSPHIDVAWLKEPYKEYPSEILEFYSLHRFIQDVLT